MKAYVKDTMVRAGAACALLAVLVACGRDETARPEGEEAGADTAAVVVSEIFETPRDTIDNIDSPAVWHGPNGEHWLLATAKETDLIVVSDATTGEVVRRVGTTGTGIGQMDGRTASRW